MTDRGTGDTTADTRLRRPIIGALLLGIGLGGFFDGIVLHQLLQWHHLIDHAGVPPDSVENLRLNILADGIFHAATYAFTVAGVLVLWSATRRRTGPWPWTVLAGGLLAGWGGFNLVEGIINHHLLGLHHVRPGEHQLLYDLGFLAWGAAMLVIGVLLLRSAVRR
ncbi:MAG TPA: DUF2243 domain-containing protein [Candidatus Limnocylindrales bacterium]|nr:DUF2243 domain-containing protein [Candidatus Limnocylindrales bacterium]